MALLTHAVMTLHENKFKHTAGKTMCRIFHKSCHNQVNRNWSISLLYVFVLDGVDHIHIWLRHIFGWSAKQFQLMDWWCLSVIHICVTFRLSFGIYFTIRPYPHQRFLVESCCNIEYFLPLYQKIWCIFVAPAKQRHHIGITLWSVGLLIHLKCFAFAGPMYMYILWIQYLSCLSIGEFIGLSV